MCKHKIDIFGSLSGLLLGSVQIKKRREEPERIGYGFLRANLDGGLDTIVVLVSGSIPFGIEKLIKEIKRNFIT